MKDKELEKAAKDEELGMNEENKTSTTNTIDNLKGQSQSKPDITDAEEPTTIGINADNTNTKASKGQEEKLLH